MKRRPLRRLLRAERMVTAKSRGTPQHRTQAFRRPLTDEQRKENLVRRMLRGFSQRKGGGWHIREAKWRPCVPELVTWSLAGLGLALLWLLLPHHVVLWGASLIGVVQGMQKTDVGNANNDGLGDNRRLGFQKLNSNMAITLMCAATLNAAWFGTNDRGQSLGLTKEQTVQAAITAAVAQGAEAVFVNKSLLPYDASAVSFNGSVHLMREGGPQDLHVFDVQAYGASNGGVDAYVAIQAASNMISASSNSTGGKVLRLGPGSFLVSQPIICASPMIIEGTGNLSDYFGRTGVAPSELVGTFAGGPILFPSGATSIPEVVAGIVTGTGNALHLTDASHYFNLRDIPTLDLNGAIALCIECFWKSDITSTAASSTVFVASSGQILRHDSTALSFVLSLLTANGAPAFHLRASGTTTTINGATSICDQLVHHVAGTWDGATMRLFVDGTQVASSAKTGTLQQAWTDDVTTAGDTGDGPEGGSLHTVTPAGIMQSLRISNIARYTANFTAPSTALTADANTLFLLPLDLQRGGLTRVKTTNGDAWCWYRPAADTGTPSMVVRGLQITSQTPGACTAIACQAGTTSATFEWLRFVNVRNGIFAPTGDCFNMRIVRLTCSDGAANSRYAICLSAFTGITTIEHPWIWSNWVIPVVISGGPCSVIGGVIAGGNGHQSFMAAAKGQIAGAVTFKNVAFYGEGASPDVNTWRGTVGLSFFGTPLGVHIFDSCHFEGLRSKPHVIVDAILSAAFRSCDFAPSGSTVMQSTSAPVRPVLFDSCIQQTWVPWSDTAGTATVGKIGKGVIAFSATPTFDASLADDFEITLTGDVTSSSLINVTPGQRISFTVIQDSTGAHAFVFPYQVEGPMTISSTPLSANVQSFVASIA